MSKLKSVKMLQALQIKKKLLIGYLLAGYPSKDDFIEALNCMQDAGVDVLEIGIPSFNPENDGQIIREANKVADFSVLDDMAFWQEVRKVARVPIWIMGYNNELISTPRYLELAKAGIADCFVLPQMCIEEHLSLAEELAPYACDVAGFVNPSTSHEEAEKCFLSLAVVYFQLHTGKTGKQTGKEKDTFFDLLSLSQRYESTYMFAGFGIDTKDRVSYLINAGFDGAVVGTAMIRHQNESLDALSDYVMCLKSGVIQE